MLCSLLAAGVPLECKVEKESVELTGIYFPLSPPTYCLAFSARRCSAPHSSHIPDVLPGESNFPIKFDASTPRGLHRTPLATDGPWEQWELHITCALWRDVCRSEEKGGDHCARIWEGNVIKPHSQAKYQKKKRERKDTEHCWWQMLVEQDANCNQPLTKITGTDFVFYLENYLFAFAAIFFFFPSFLGDFFFQIYFLFRMIHAVTGQLTDKCRQKCKYGDFSHSLHSLQSERTKSLFFQHPSWPKNEFRSTEQE